MNIALMSHDNKKELMVQFCTAYAGILSHHNIYATNTTGHMVADATGLNVHCFLSYAHGGSQQIGARIAYNEFDLVLFFNDPNNEAMVGDVSYISRLCDQNNIPFASNLATAEALVLGLAGAIWTGAASSIPPTVPSLDIFPQSAYNHPVDSFAPRGCRSSTPIAAPQRGAPLRAARPAWTKDSGGAGAETPTAPSP